MSRDREHKYYPLGDSALTLELGNEISEDTNELAVEIAQRIAKRQFPGFIESVPHYASVTVFYDPRATRVVKAPGESCFEAVRKLTADVAAGIDAKRRSPSSIIEIAVDFSKGVDLDFVAEHNGIDPKKVIEIFLSKDYRVYMLGFIPGFAYLGTLDMRISAPRMDTPRKHVSPGSVGIAGLQTGIYPLRSPGGWRLIGRTESPVFFKDRPAPSLFSPGDTVKFVEA